MSTLRAKLALIFAPGVLAALACGGSAEPVESSGQSIIVCDPIKCEPGSIFSPELCKCVCVDDVACIVGEHWDSETCRCVPDKCGKTTCGSGEYCCGCGDDEGICLSDKEACPLLCPAK
jgi:hypothetical protein